MEFHEKQQELRAFLKSIKTPINLPFSVKSAPISLAMRQHGCEKLACLTKKFCVSVHSATFQKRSRKQKNLTQEELSEILFVSRTAISKWETGRGYPSIDSLQSFY